MGLFKDQLLLLTLYIYRKKSHQDFSIIGEQFCLKFESIIC